MRHHNDSRSKTLTARLRRRYPALAGLLMMTAFFLECALTPNPKSRRRSLRLSFVAMFFRR